jgi:hypothetical protein
MDQSDIKFLNKVINAYGKALEERSLSIGLETKLPFPKDVIRFAIYQVLHIQDLDINFRQDLEAGYIELESFLPAEEYEILEPFYAALTDEGKITTGGESKVKQDWEKAVQAMDNAIKATDAQLLKEIQDRMRARMGQRLKEIEALGSIRGLPAIEEKS